MNTQLKKIAEEFDLLDIEGKFWHPAFEPFAEALILECALRCEHIAVKNQVEETTYAAGKKAGAFECAAELRQHFEVDGLDEVEE